MYFCNNFYALFLILVDLANEFSGQDPDTQNLDPEVNQSPKAVQGRVQRVLMLQKRLMVSNFFIFNA